MSKPVTKISIAMGMCVPLNPKAVTNTHYICKVNDCNSTLSAVKSSNITLHMETRHSETFKERFENAKLSNVDKADMETRRLDLIQSWTQSVTRDGRPLSLLYDAGFRRVNRKEVETLKKAGYGNGLSCVDRCPPVVYDHIRYLSAQVIDAIKIEIKDLLLSIMVDIGSRNGRDILGISIQYMYNGRVHIRSLGMILLCESHTAENIKNKMLACLKIFDIKASQIVSITTDNASNMISMIKSFNRVTDDSSGQDDDDTPDSENDSSNNVNDNDNYFDVQIEEIERIIDEYRAINSMSDAEIEAERRNVEAAEILEDTSHYLNLLKELGNEFILYTLNTHGIKCAAHTLQLAIKNALKSSKIAILIQMCRMICKLLRKQAYKNKMREQNFEEVSPPLDCKVRWNSTFKMVIYIFVFLFPILCLNNALYIDCMILN